MQIRRHISTSHPNVVRRITLRPTSAYSGFETLRGTEKPEAPEIRYTGIQLFHFRKIVFCNQFSRERYFLLNTGFGTMTGQFSNENLTRVQ